MTDQNAAERPPADLTRPPRRRRRIGLWSLAIGIGALAVVAGLLCWRLLAGPLWTSVGVASIAEEIAATAGPGATADLGVAGLSLGAGLAPRLHLRDLRIAIPGDGSVSIDTLQVETTWSTLFGRDRRVGAVVGDHVFVEAEAGERPTPAIAELLAGLDDAVAATGIAHLDIGAFTLKRRAEAAPARLLLDRVALTADRTDAGLAATLAAAGAVGPWSIRATTRVEAATGRRLVDLTTRGLDVADVALMAGDNAPAFTGPLEATGQIALGPDGALAEGRGQLSVGPLIQASDGGEGPITEASRLVVSLRPADGALIIEPSPITLPVGRAVITGAVLPPTAEGGPWRYDLSTRAETTEAAGGDAMRGRLSGSYDPAGHLLLVDRLEAEGEGARFSAAMRLYHGDGALIGALSGVFPAMSVDTLKDIWPPMVAGEARSWVLGHMLGGQIEDATVDIGFSGGGLAAGSATPAAATVGFRFRDLSFRPFDGGPLIVEAAGTGRLVGERFEVALESGVVDIEDGRRMQLGASSFVVPSITVEPPRGDIALQLTGDAAAAFALWKRIPLSDGMALPAEPDAVRGKAEGEIRLSLPLIKDLPAADVIYDGTIAFSGLAFSEPVDGRSIDKGEITLRVAEGVAAIRGTAAIDGVPADLSIDRPLARGGASAGTIRLTLGDDDRRALGVDLGSAVRGPIGVTLVTRPAADGAGAQAATLDLSKATIDFPALGFRKPKGRAGSARFTLRSDGGRTLVDDLDITIGDASARGRLVVGEGGRLISAEFSRLRLTARDDMAVTLARGDGETLKLRLRGDRFDARGLIRALKQRTDGGAEPAASLEIDASLGAVSGFSDEAISGVNIAARLSAGAVSTLSLTAQTGGGGAASATLTPDGGARRLRVEVGEIGRLLRFLDLYPRVEGGRATLDGVIEKNGALRASMDGSRWRIVDEPGLARLSTAATDGPDAGTSTAVIQRLMFEMRFSDGLLTIADGVVRAETAGLSLQGDVDFRRDVLRMSGTYLPASAFDSLLGKIPLLGQTVFAGGRAGLLGVSFRLTGPIDDPSLSVNPLSVIAPGIFRKLFELQ